MRPNVACSDGDIDFQGLYWTMHFLQRGDLASCVWLFFKLSRDNSPPTEDAGN